jgi:L-ascorbate metabolism protein UlaG (beta-lactamase superfamily)
MARQAQTLGYQRMEVLEWDEVREPAPGLTVEAVPAGRTAIWPNNAYVFGSGGTRVFFGGEIADVTLLERYRSRRDPVSVALLPVNGLRPLVGPPLVMGHREAVAEAELLGARVLVPIHDAHGNDLLSLVVRRHGSAADAKALATGLDVVCLTPGQRRTLTSTEVRYDDRDLH